MVEAFECGIKAVDDVLQRRFKDLPEERQSDINRRIEHSLRQLNSVATTAKDSGLSREARAHAEDIFRNILSTASLSHISPGATKGLAHHLAMNIGLNRRGLGLLDDFTDSGAVANIIKSLRRRGGGEIHQMLAHIHFIDRNIIADQRLDALRRTLNITKDDWDRLKLDALEIGMQPFMQKDLGVVGPAGIEFLRGKQQRFFRRLEELGVTDSAADLLAKETTEVANTYREVLEVIRTFGVNTNDADGLIAYLPRSVSPETIRRFQWHKLENGNYNIGGFGGVSTESLPSVFTKSRTSNQFIVEDKIVLDELIRAVDEDIYSSLGVDGIDGLIEDTGKLTRGLVETLDRRAPELFDGLVDVGMISKIPMTSTELFEYAKLRYELPFKTIDEFMATDFRQVATLYRNQTERLVGRSVMSHFTAKSAIDGGWGITEAQRLAEPEKYKNWVQLSSPVAGRSDVVITAAEAQRFGMPAFQHSHVYVHPVVADIFKAQTQVLSRPDQLGILGRLANDLRTTFSTMALASSGFVFRQLYTPIFQVWAAGGRIDTYAADITRSIAHIAGLKSRGLSLDQFDGFMDNTRKIYRVNNELVTERSLWNIMRRRGFVEEVLPWLGAPANSRNFKPSAGFLTATERQVRYLNDVINAYPKLGALGTVSEFASTISEGSRRFGERAFHWFGATNVLFDNVARFSTIKALTSTTNTNRIVKAAQGNFNNNLGFEQAVERAQRYFFNYDDTGRVDDFMAHIRPFWVFQSRNTFAIFKMMTREPGKFMAYQRLFAAINEPEQGDEPLPYGAMPDWMRGESPMFWIQRDDEGNPTEAWTLPRSMFDPIAEGTGAVTEGLDGLLNYFGIWPDGQFPSRGIDDRLNDLPWNNTPTNRALEDQVSQAFGHYKAAYSLITGRNPDTGREFIREGDTTRFSNFLGMEVSPMTQYIAENLFPILRNVNRANPFYMFGYPPEFDTKTGEVIDMGTPSWFGTSGTGRPSADFRSWWQRSLSTVGFNIYRIDILESMGYRETDILFALREGETALEKKRRDIRLLTNEQQFNREVGELREMEALHAALMIDYENIRAWADNRGLDYSAAIRFARKENIAAEQLRGLTPDEERKLLEKVYGPLENFRR